jgi:hypothetical protein
VIIVPRRLRPLAGHGLVAVGVHMPELAFKHKGIRKLLMREMSALWR